MDSLCCGIPLFSIVCLMIRKKVSFLLSSGIPEISGLCSLLRLSTVVKRVRLFLLVPKKPKGQPPDVKLYVQEPQIRGEFCYFASLSLQVILKEFPPLEFSNEKLLEILFVVGLFGREKQYFEISEISWNIWNVLEYLKIFWKIWGIWNI